jgi:hypothetical protein
MLIQFIVGDPSCSLFLFFFGATAVLKPSLLITVSVKSYLENRLDFLDWVWVHWKASLWTGKHKKDVDRHSCRNGI